MDVEVSFLKTSHDVLWMWLRMAPATDYFLLKCRKPLWPSRLDDDIVDDMNTVLA